MLRLHRAEKDHRIYYPAKVELLMLKIIIKRNNRNTLILDEWLSLYSLACSPIIIIMIAAVWEKVVRYHLPEYLLFLWAPFFAVPFILIIHIIQR